MKIKPALPLLLVLAVNAACLAPELRSVPDLNDNVLHLTLINGMVKTIEAGGNPLDFYSPEIGLGQNIVKLYQPGAHLIATAVYFALFKSVSVWTVFLWVRFLALALMPLTFWYAARLLELSKYAPIAAAVLSCLISGDSFGIDYGSYVWSGHGLFPQAVATHFLLLAIGLAWRSMHGKAWWYWTAYFLILTGWCNLFYGYVGALIVCLIAVMTRQYRQLAKIAAAGLLFALPKLAAWISSGQLTPGQAAGPRAFMVDSYGAIKVLTNLFTGQMLDAGRWPVLTVLVMIGIAGALYSGRNRNQFLCGGFALMLALYFGRPFWGDTLYLVGITPSMQLHRAIGPLQIFGVLLGALALDMVYRRIPGAYGILAIGLILSPAIQERREYLAQNGQWLKATGEAFTKEGRDMDRALTLAQVRGGRAYAGLPAAWGKDFKIGSVPVYSLFPVRGIPCIGFLYIQFTEKAGSMYLFNDQEPRDYAAFDVRTVISPLNAPRPDLDLLATFGRFAVYRPR